MILLFSWMAVLQIGKRLPYLEFQSSYLVRSSLLFATLFGLLAYEMFLKRRKSGTAMQQHLRAFIGWRRRSFQWLVVISGVILFPAFLAITSGYFPALATQLLARNAFTEGYLVLDRDVTNRRYFSVLLQSNDGRQAALNVPRVAYPIGTWAVGARVCLSGSAWVFGRRVDNAEPDTGQCRASPPSL